MHEMHEMQHIHPTPNPMKLRQLHLQALWTASSTQQLCIPLTSGGLAPQQLCNWRSLGKSTQWVRGSLRTAPSTSPGTGEMSLRFRYRQVA